MAKMPKKSKMIKSAKFFKLAKMCQRAAVEKTTKTDLMAEKAEIALLNKIT